MSGTLIGQIGGAVGALFTAQGNAAEADSYSSAAQLEEQNAQLTAASTRIQETQTAIQVSQSLGTTQADVAGAGFTESGSALDLLKSSAQQGALATSLVNIQGAINENSYAAVAGADVAKAKAANEAQTAGTISAIASIGGALLGGGTQLASAGNTVVQGATSVYNYAGALLNPTADAQATAGLDSIAGGVGVGSGGVTDAEIESQLSSSDLFPASMSATDASIADGAGVGDLVTSGAAVDTSGLAIGTTEAEASAGIGDAIASGAVVDAGADAVAADAAGAAAVDAGATAAAADAGGADILGSIGDALAVAAC